MKPWITVFAVLGLASAAHANLLVGTHTDNNNNNFIYDYTGTGWQSKGAWNGGGNNLTNALVGVATGDNWGVAQVISVGSATGSGLQFSFDWTPSATALNNSLSITYQLIGIVETNGAVAGTDMNFTGMNFNGKTVDAYPNSGAEVHYVDLLTGNADLFINTSNGSAYPSAATFASAAGVTASFSGTFSAAAGSFANLADYDYIGVRFLIDSDNDPTNTGATITNIALVAIPEPATLGMIAAMGGSILFIRRRFMM